MLCTKTSPVHLHGVTGILKGGKAEEWIKKLYIFPSYLYLLKLQKLNTHKLELRLVLSSCPLCNWSLSLLTGGDSWTCCCKNTPIMYKDRADSSSLTSDSCWFEHKREHRLTFGMLSRCLLSLRGVLDWLRWCSLLRSRSFLSSCSRLNLKQRDKPKTKLGTQISVQLTDLFWKLMPKRENGNKANCQLIYDFSKINQQCHHYKICSLYSLHIWQGICWWEMQWVTLRKQEPGAQSKVVILTSLKSWDTV